MQKIRSIWTFLLLFASNHLLHGAAGRPEDGLLFFILLLGFFGLLLGILQLADYIKYRIRRFLDGIMEGLLP